MRPGLGGGNGFALGVHWQSLVLLLTGPECSASAGLVKDERLPRPAIRRGEQQRVSVAAQWLTGPPLLICDEPISNSSNFSGHHEA